MNADSQPLLQHIRRLAGNPPGLPCDDELLRRYLVAREESAFTALVRRHGSMVFSVCQSVLRQREDAEDAYQAVFLILAQKASSIRQQEGLSGWLQRVAYRVALKARADKHRRQQREARTSRSSVTKPSEDNLSWGEVRMILHAELAALPESLRAPLVLCYLEGRTQEEAARQLGWPLSTIRGRLQRGREKLRRRLERRGVALTAALGAALAGQTLAESAAPSLSMTTATTAAAALARGFLHPMLPMMLSVVLLSLGVVAGGLALRSPSEPRPFESNSAEPGVSVDAHGDPLPDGAVARLGTVRFNHGDGLRSLLFSPDGKTILSRGEQRACLWDTATGAERGRVDFAKPVCDEPLWNKPEMAFRPDGKTMISLHQHQKYDMVREWDFATQKEIETRRRILLMGRGEISASRRNALSADGRFAAVNAPTELRVFDLMTGRELYKLAKGGKDIFDVVFAGDRLVTVDSKQIIDLWEAKTGKLIHCFDNGAPAGYLAASRDGRWLAVLEHRHEEGIGHWPDQDRVHIWDLTAGTKKYTLTARPQHWFRSAYFLGDGNRLLTSSLRKHGSELTVWDVSSGQRLREIPDAYGNAIAVSPDGRRVAVAVGYDYGKFYIWDLDTGHNLSNPDGFHAWTATVSFSPAGNRIHTIGYHSLSTWDAQTGKHLHALPMPRSSGWNTPRRSFSPDGRYAVSFTGGGKEFQVIIWDVAARRPLHTLRLPSKENYVYIDDAFSPDSSLLAIWQPKSWHPTTGRLDTEAIVRIWNVRTGKEIRSFTASKSGWPGQLSFSADGEALIVAGKHVVGFDVVNCKELFSWHMKPLLDKSGTAMVVNGIPIDPKDRCAWRALAVSPDGARIACILDSGFGRQPLADRLALFNARTGKPLRRWSDSGKPTRNYECIEFSADGQLLASSDGFAIHLWEAATGKEIRTFRGHRSEIVNLAFSSDGRRLASTSWDSTVLIWDLIGQTGKPRSGESIEKYWKDLLGEDAALAHRAVWALARAPVQSLPLLKAHLHPVQLVSREQLDRLIADLDSDKFVVREKATNELEKLGELAEPALRRVLANKPTLEQRRRIEPMLAKLERAIPFGQALRSLRALRVLELAGTAEAQQLLRELAGGAEGAALTRTAQAALTRLNRRSP